MTLELHATPEEVMRAVEALQEFGRRCGVDERELCRLALVLEECASNVVNHGLRRDGGKTFRVFFEHSGDSFILELRDGGAAFDPTATPATKQRSTDDAELPGGWGLQLIRRYTDEIFYTRDRGENVLRLTKRLPQRPTQD